jgi:hypothetical protein
MPPVYCLPDNLSITLGVRMVIDDVDIDLVASQVQSQAVGAEGHLVILFAGIYHALGSHASPRCDLIYLLNCYFDRVGKVITK